MEEEDEKKLYDRLFWLILSIFRVQAVTQSLEDGRTFEFGCTEVMLVLLCPPEVTSLPSLPPVG